MTRRGLLKALTTGVVGIAVATHVPALWMPTAALRRETALEYLRRAYNDWLDRHGLKRLRYIDVGRELFEAAGSEMVANMRFYSYDEDVREGPPTLMFKGTRLRAVGRGWEIKAFHA